MPAPYGMRVVRGQDRTFTFWVEHNPGVGYDYFYLCSDLDPTPQQLPFALYDADQVWDAFYYQNLLVVLRWFADYDPEFPNTRFIFKTSPDDGEHWYDGWWVPPHYP